MKRDGVERMGCDVGRGDDGERRLHQEAGQYMLEMERVVGTVC